MRVHGPQSIKSFIRLFYDIFHVTILGHEAGVDFMVHNAPAGGS
jgi:hypothetical protein